MQFFIAQIGRTVGLHGDLKLHLHTDFPEQFQPGTTLESDRGRLTILSYNSDRDLIRFEGYSSMESAKRLTNAKLYASEAQTRACCQLAEGEHFWFDIIGASLYEGGERIGRVKEIDRMLETDYLVIETDKALRSEGLAKEFLLPYIPRYILSVDSAAKRIEVQDARDILEAS